MYKLFFPLLLAVAISSAACGQTASQSQKMADWKTLDEDAFSIQYPSDWELNQSGQMGSSFILFSPPIDETDQFRENVNLIIQDVSAYNLTLEQFTEISEEQVKTLITDSEILSSDVRQGEVYPYQKLLYTGRQGQYDLTFEQYYWLVEGKAYVLTFTSEQETFESYQEVGEKILGSFVLK